MIAAAVESEQEKELETRITVGLEKEVDSTIPEYTPGITGVISTIEVIVGITTHPSFPFVARAISDAFKPNVPWTAQTRDALVRQIEGKIPTLNGYELKHLIRSLSYVYELENIPCRSTYYGMSAHVNEAVRMLEKMGKKPSDIIAYLRYDDELGVVDEVLLPDDDMALDLAICQAKTIWDGIHRLPTPRRPRLLVYDFTELASCKGVLDIYAGVGETLVDQGPGIAHAASWAYEKLGTKKMLNTGPFRRPAARLQGQVLAADEGAACFARDREGASLQRE